MSLDHCNQPKPTNRVLGIDEAMVELFMPTKQHNCKTDAFCYELAVDVAITLLSEMEDTRKATHLYLSTIQGEYSQAVISESGLLASYEMRPNHYPLEENIATLTDVLSNGRQINLASAAGIGRARCNHDYYCGHEK